MRCRLCGCAIESVNPVWAGSAGYACLDCGIKRSDELKTALLMLAPVLKGSTMDGTKELVLDVDIHLPVDMLAQVEQIFDDMGAPNAWCAIGTEDGGGLEEVVALARPDHARILAQCYNRFMEAVLFIQAIGQCRTGAEVEDFVANNIEGLLERLEETGAARATS